ncbi:hypothetical protein MW887_005669 [Aspergillus wentii]|nr:hypothetical protein MW887_005669 [Aspergillus wentii]
MDKNQENSFYASQTFSTSPQNGLPSYGEVISGSSQNTTPPASQPKGAKLTTKTLDSSLAKDPHELHNFILRQASIPPSISLVVKGTHEGNNDHTVEDFHFCIDITSDILNPQSQGPHWADIHIVADGDGRNVYRGGRHRSRRDKKRHLEDGNEPGLMGWCRRFCGDSAKVKSFTLKRKIQGFNFPAVKSTLTSYLRVINYRGKISMKIAMANTKSTVYSANWVNRLRNNRCVAGLCYVSQLWIFTWPTIKFLERRYKVVEST